MEWVISDHRPYETALSNENLTAQKKQNKFSKEVFVVV